MRRARRLPPVAISHLETHHAYTSPPVPEKGGLPTIIVTPADSSSASEFEIHFYSPKASEMTFGSYPNVASPPNGFMPRMRSFFRRSPPISQQPPTQSPGTEKATYRGSAYEEDIAEARCNVNVNVNIINVHSTSSAEVPRIIVTRPTRNGGYVSIPQDEEMGDIRRRSMSQESEDDEEDGDIVMDTIVVGVPTISEQDWTALNMPSGPLLVQSTGGVMGVHDSTAATLMVGGGRPSLLTRRMRTLLFLSIPVALVGLHFFNHYMPSFFGSPEVGGAQESTWFDVPSAPLSGPTF